MSKRRANRERSKDYCVTVTVDILLSGGWGWEGSTNEKGRNREIHFKKD